MWGSIVLKLLESLGGGLSKYFDSKEKEEQFKNELTQSLLNQESEFQKASLNNVYAEIKGESWLQRNWRPLGAVSLFYIVFHSYILDPWLHYVWGIHVPIALDQNIWDLLKICVGGYGVARSGEKMVNYWSQAQIGKANGSPFKK